jgi:hypothetical protein
MSHAIEVGKVYEVSHSRKGEFQMRVVSVSGEWVEGVVTNGRANAMLSYNEKYAGDAVSLRMSHIRSTREVKP